MRIINDGEFHLDVTDNGQVYNFMVDNMQPGMSPEAHMFAGVTVPKHMAGAVLASLAEAMGKTIKFIEPVVLPETAVHVTDNSKEEWYTEGENRYTISGDVDDFLTDDEAADLASKWEKLKLENGSWSSNYFVADILAQEQGGRSVVTDVEFDPEGMCFFAYTSDEAKANEIADWINQKKFLA